MVKQGSVVVEIANCTVQRYYDIAYGDETAVQRYHAEVNQKTAEVTPWVDGCRQVSFNMPINVPGFLKKIIGVDNVEVDDAQRLVWRADHQSFEVVSEPAIKMPGAGQFKTSGLVTVSPAAAGACRVECAMSCTAFMPWPMQGSVEGVMMTEAIASTRKYLEFCKALCGEPPRQLPPAAPPVPPPAAAVAVAAAAAPAAAAVAAVVAAAPAAIAAAALADSTPSTSSAARDASPPATRDEASSDDLFYDTEDHFQGRRSDAALLECLQRIALSSAAGAQSLGALEALLGGVDARVAALQLLQQQQQAAATRPAGAAQQPAGAAARACTAVAEPAGVSGGSWYPWLVAFGVGCAAGSLVTLSVMRTRKASG